MRDVDIGTMAPAYPIFSIGGVNFNDYRLIKMLCLDDYVDGDLFKSVHIAGGSTPYQVPTGKVFIAFKVVARIESGNVNGIFGESATDGGAITKHVLRFSNGTTNWFTHDVIGIFAAGKYITGSTSDNNVKMRDGGALYGIEIEA